MTCLDDAVEVIYSTVGRSCCPCEEFKVVDGEGVSLPLNTEGETGCEETGSFHRIIIDNK